jgi:hypothetical protein
VTCHYASTGCCKPRKIIYTTLEGVTTYPAPNLCRSCTGVAADVCSLARSPPHSWSRWSMTDPDRYRRELDSDVFDVSRRVQVWEPLARRLPALAKAVRHSVGETVSDAVLGVARYLWRSDRALALTCVPARVTQKLEKHAFRDRLRRRLFIEQESACDPRSVRKASRRGHRGSGRRVGGAREFRWRQWTATNHPMCAGRFPPARSNSDIV